ncbi:MAG: chemotaxis protein CheW [Deltaproteobacteria bacterium]|nr:chemotaxis protein CheW [Deltaproteobacteria bacterium]
MVGDGPRSKDDRLFDAAEAQREARGSLEEAVAGAQREALLAFELGPHTVAVKAEHIHEVTDPIAPVPLPQAPAHVKGLVLVGERILPQVDLLHFLRLEEVERDKDAFGRMLVVEAGTDRVALLCGRVRGLTERHGRTILEPSVLNGTVLGPYLAGEIHDAHQVIGVIDLGALLAAAAVR